MEVVIDYEYLSGARGEVIKEVSLASETSSIHSVFNPLLHESPYFPHLRPGMGGWTYSLFIIIPNPNRGHD